MTVYYFSDQIRTEIVHEKQIQQLPRWNLLNGSFILSPFWSIKEQTQVFLSTQGSGGWLGWAPDEYRFSEGSRELVSMWLSDPEHNVPSLQSSAILRAQYVAGIPQLIEDLEEKATYTIDSAEIRWMDEKGEVLICLLREESSEVERYSRVQAAGDFELIFWDNHLLGWMLHQPVKYITTSIETPPMVHEPTALEKQLTAQYISIVTNPNFSRMHKKDQEIYSQMLDLRNIALREVGNHPRLEVLALAIDNIWERYY